jgi:hypothetical protein
MAAIVVGGGIANCKLLSAISRQLSALRGYPKREGEAPAEPSFLGKNAAQQELRPPKMPLFG